MTTGAGKSAVEDAKRRLSRRRISTKATSAGTATQQAENAAGDPHEHVRYLATSGGDASRARESRPVADGTSRSSKSSANRDREDIRKESFGETEIFYITSVQSKLTFFSSQSHPKFSRIRQEKVFSHSWYFFSPRTRQRPSRV